MGIGATNSRKRHQNSVAQTAQDKRDRQKVTAAVVVIATVIAVVVIRDALVAFLLFFLFDGGRRLTSKF